MSQTREAVRSIKDAVSHVDVDAVAEQAQRGFDYFKNLPQNVGEHEKTLSIIGGSVLAAVALTRLNRLSGLALLAMGAGLVYRGATGHCGVYDKLNINTAE